MCRQGGLRRGLNALSISRFLFLFSRGTPVDRGAANRCSGAGARSGDCISLEDEPLHSSRHISCGQAMTHKSALLCVPVSLVAIALALLFPPGTCAQLQTDPLLRGFQTPPNSAKPRVWWHWMDGNVTK